MGGSGIYIGTINILSSLTSVSERPLYLSFVGMAWSLGTVWDSHMTSRSLAKSCPGPAPSSVVPSRSAV